MGLLRAPHSWFNLIRSPFFSKIKVYMVYTGLHRLKSVCPPMQPQENAGNAARFRGGSRSWEGPVTRNSQQAWDRIPEYLPVRDRGDVIISPFQVLHEPHGNSLVCRRWPR
jgi:hypothetical protein